MAKRWPMMVGGLMIAGVAAGAVGAMMSRRRQRKWNDYGSTGTSTISNIKDETRATASSIADTAKDKANDVLGQMKGATDSTSTTTSPQMAGSSTRTSDFGAQGESYKPGSSATGSRNSRPWFNIVFEGSASTRSPRRCLQPAGPAEHAVERDRNPDASRRAITG